jgi:hypothetical protein
MFRNGDIMGIYGSMDAPTSPRCASCENVLPHEGAICWICQDQEHFELPTPRTSPPFRREQDPFEGAEGRFWRASDLGRRKAGYYDGNDTYAV